MRSLAPLLTRLLVTAIVVAVAAVVGWQLWVYYLEAPWTRDGRVRADVVQVAPDVSGLVTEVAVRDNQRVAKGELLFRIDRERFRLAWRRPRPPSAAGRPRLAQAQRDAERYRRAGRHRDLAGPTRAGPGGRRPGDRRLSSRPRPTATWPS